MSLFTRKFMDGNKGLAVDIALFSAFVAGILLISTNIVDYYATGYGGEFKIGYREFFQSSYSPGKMIALGAFFIVASLFLRLKIKTGAPLISIAMVAMLIVNGFDYFLDMAGFVSSIAMYFVFICIVACVISSKAFKVSAQRTILVLAYVFVVTSAAPMYSVGNTYNKIFYTNHLKLQGKHATFANLAENCKEDSFNWFLAGVWPVKEPCYFERYMEEGEELTQEKNALLNIYYGALNDLSNFSSFNHQQSIANYSEKEAVFLYQIAYESIQRRLAMAENETLLEIQQIYLKVEAENYKKSLEMEPQAFIAYLRSMEPSKEVLSAATLESLDYYDQDLQPEDREKVKFDDLVRYEQEIYHSGKSTLFGDQSKAYGHEIDYATDFNLRDLIRALFQ
jgi:hypothetical protein